MPANLLLCLSTKENTGYLFRNTGKRVFSFEEALYHVSRYWKQSMDDFLSEPFIDWVQNGLELPYIASRIRDAGMFDSFARRLTAFLSVADYIGQERLSALEEELDAWERRLEWERLKERADFMMGNDEPERALVLYRRALALEERPELYHNTGVAFCALGQYKEAIRYHEGACALEPEDAGWRLGLIEALILDGEYARAENAATGVLERDPENADALCFSGDIARGRGQLKKAVGIYRESYALRPDPEYIYRAADTYAHMRMFDEAIDVMEAVKRRDKRFLTKQAEIYAAAGNMAAAVKVVRRALETDGSSSGLWTRLACYHRLDYNLPEARKAVSRALELEPENPRALLESARVQKALGRVKDYQNILNRVLRGFKREYREGVGQ